MYSLANQFNYSKIQLAYEKKCTSNGRATTANASASVADGLFSAFFSTILHITTFKMSLYTLINQHSGIGKLA